MSGWRMGMLLSAALLAAAQAQSNPSPPPPGRLVDIGQGVSLHIYCTGRGSRAVILLHGLGDYSFDWALVQPTVSERTKTCSYDRAAQAWSSPGKPPRGPNTAAQELHTLLDRAGIKPPYVLVGHSWGGLVARIYAHAHPGEVAGIVLVESAEEDEYLWINGKVVRPLQMSEEDWQLLMKPRPRPAATAQENATPPPAPPRPAPPPHLEPPFDKLPSSAQQLRLWAMSIPWSKERFAGGDIQDFRGDFIEVHEALSGEHPLGDLPVVVISKTPGAEAADDEDYTKEQLEWNRNLQDKLAGESSNSLHIVAKHSGHHVQLDDPALVSAAIFEVLRAVRSKQPVNASRVPDR